MLTTTLNKPNAMELNMPKKDKTENIKINEELLLNIILDKENAVWWYEGTTVFDLRKRCLLMKKALETSFTGSKTN